MHAIETRYKGYKFRSRLEARWAVFFDALGLDWEYEPEGFDINGTYYLPDFIIRNVVTRPWLNEGCDLYVEVKGVPNKADAEKIKAFSKHAPIWVVGKIPDPSDYINDMQKMRENHCSECAKHFDHVFCTNDYGLIDGDLCFEFSLDYADGHLVFRGCDSSYGFGSWSNDIANAFRTAREARFDRKGDPHYDYQRV